jgi:hypothetical protein
LLARVLNMDPHGRAVSVWYRIAGLISREQKTLAVEILEAEIRSGQEEVLLEAAKLVLSGEPVEVSRELRDRRVRATTKTSSVRLPWGGP